MGGGTHKFRDVRQTPRLSVTVPGRDRFYGWAVRNYSMCAIAGMVCRLRERPRARGLVGANGGFMPRYSVGIYSTEPGWSPPAR